MPCKRPVNNLQRHFKFGIGAQIKILAVFDSLTSSPPWKGRGFPPKGFIVPTIGSGLHPSFGGQSGGSENHPRGLSSKLRLVPLRGKRDGRCSSHSPIKPSIELGRSVISITKRKIEELIFKYKGAIHPRSSKRRGFPPLNPQFL